MKKTVFAVPLGEHVHAAQVNEMIHCRTDLPVVLLTDINPHWPLHEIQERVTTTKLLMNSMRVVGHPVTSITMETDELPEALYEFNPAEVIVFNLCDEAPGYPRSCWLIAQKLEKCGYTFTGADSQSLIISQDKRQILRQLCEHGVSIPRWEEYTALDRIDWERFPAIVKPAFEHCSNGIDRESVVETSAELILRIRFILEKFQQPALVEEFIDGPEFHVGVIGNNNPTMLPPALIDYSEFCDIHDRLCTYESNFDSTSLAYRITAPKFPAGLTAHQLGLLKDMVTTAYQVTGCRDYARMDVRMRENIFYLLDVNHNADIGENTSMTLGAKSAGLSYGQFGSLLINLAARRHEVFGASLLNVP